MDKHPIRSKFPQAFPTLVVALILSWSTTASADVIAIWAKPKVDYVSGSGEVFKRFEGTPAYGAELGLELMGLSFWFDAEMMGEAQYWASGNLGFDLSLGDDFKVTVGGYGGGVFFGFPEEPAVNNEGLNLTAEEQTLLQDQGVDYGTIESKYNKTLEAERKAARTAFGVNARLRLTAEYTIVPLLSIGVQASTGYHIIVSGEAAASDIKSRAIDEIAKEHDLPDEATTLIKDAAGAEEVDLEDLKGLNYSAGVFINFRF